MSGSKIKSGSYRGKALLLLLLLLALCKKGEVPAAAEKTSMRTRVAIKATVVGGSVLFTVSVPLSYSM